MGDISLHLTENQEAVGQRISGCDDILLRPMKLGKGEGISCFLIYIEVAASNMMLEDSVIGKLLNHLWDMEPEEITAAIAKNSLGISDTKELLTMDEAFAAMLAGNVVLFVDHFDKAIKIGSKGYPGVGVQKSESEKVLRGSREAFSESVKINTALIRKRIRDTELKVKEKPLGRHSDTMTAMLWLEGVAYPPVTEELERKLESFEIDGVTDSGVIEQLTADLKHSPFPQYQTTERPDRAAQAVLEGRVVLLCDNSPEALLLPVTLNSLFQTSDDYYRHFAIVSFLRLIRYLGAFLAVSLPGLYLAAVNFHTQLLPTPLILSLAEAREGVPFPAFLEVLLMELAFELLREAGLRMPGPIGNTIGIVGGLIIGQAAVSANIVSPVVVVLVALTALGSFAIPNEEISEALRLLKYLVFLLCAVFGILGLVLGWILILIHLAGVKSFGVSYLSPFSGSGKAGERKDALLRAPLDLLRQRPIFARKENRRKLRMKGGQP